MAKKGDRKEPGKGSRNKRPPAHRANAAERSKPKGNKVVHFSEKRQTKVKFRTTSKKQGAPAQPPAAKVTPIRRRRRLRFIPVDTRARLTEHLNEGLKVKLRELAIAWRLRRAVKESARARYGVNQDGGAGGRRGERRPIPPAARFPGLVTEEAPGRIHLQSILAGLWEGLQGWLADYRGWRGKPRHRTLNIEGITSLLLAALLFYPPFFKGLIGTREMMVTHIITAVILAGYACYRLVQGRPLPRPRTLDYAVLLLLVLYLGSSMMAVDSGAALSAVLDSFNYAAIYWLLASSLRSVQGARHYLEALLASGVGVCLISLGTAFGTLHYPNAFSGGRIFTTLQYPNSAASWLTVISLLGLYLGATARGNRNRMLLAAANYLLLLTITGTGSLSGLIIYPLGLILMLAGLPGRARWRSLGCFAIGAVAVALTAENILSSTGGGAEAAGWVWLACGGVLAGGIQYLWCWFESFSAAGMTAAGSEGERKGQGFKLWKVPLIALAIIILFGCGRLLLASGNGTTGAQTALARLAAVAPGERSSYERLVWSRDAWRVIIASPVNALLGTGGGGWNASYHRYQSYFYTTSYLYNHLLQVGVETGLLGMLAYLAIWFYFMAGCWQSWLNCKRGEGGAIDGAVVPLIPYQYVRGTIWVTFSGAAVLGLHSLIDFNLSLGAVAILLWACFGIGRGLEHLYGGTEQPVVVRSHASPGVIPAKHRSRLHQALAVAAAALVVCFLSLAVLEGRQHADAADQAAAIGDTKGAVRQLERALAWDHWNKDYPAQLSQLLFYQAETDRNNDLPARAEQLAGLAVARGREDAGNRLNYARILLANGKYEAGIEQLEEAARAMPFQQEVYDNLASGCTSVGKAALAAAANGAGGTRPDLSPEQGRRYLAEALNLPSRIKARMRAVPPESLKLWGGAPLLTPSANVYLQAGEAAVLLGEGQGMDYLKRAAGDPNLKAEALLWQGLAREQGVRGSGQSLIKKALQLQPSLSPGYRRALLALKGAKK